MTAARVKPAGPIKEELVGLGHIAMYGTVKGVDEDIVYAFVKALAENVTEIHRVHPILPEYTKETLARPLPIEFHPGAIRYYREAGLWTAEIDETEKGHNEAVEAFRKRYAK